MFTFEIGSKVKLKFTNEKGEIIARAEYNTSENCYLVRYAAGDGRQVESWWNEGAIEWDSSD